MNNPPLEAVIGPERAERVGGSSWWVLAVLIPSAILAQSSQDVAEYHRYALAFWAHPGGAWPLEYPPFAILPMLTATNPALFPFAMALVGVILFGTLQRANLHAAGTWLMGCALGALFTVTGRFDLLPSLLVVFALLSAERGHWGRAWVWTAGAAALQWFGAVLGPLWLIAEWRATGRWRWERAALAGGAVLATYGVAAIGAGGHAALSSVLWYLRRPVQIESLAATLGNTLGRLRLVNSFGSWNVLGAQMPGLRLGFLVAQLAGQAAIWVAYARGRLGIRMAAALAVTWLVLAGTLFSAQYLLWMLPLWALADWRPRWLLLLVCFLTTVVYPFSYSVLDTEAGVLLAAGARNIVLLALVAITATHAATARTSTSHSRIAE